MANTKMARLCGRLAVTLFLPAALLAQQPDQGPAPKPNAHMESRIGKLTGHSEAGAQLFYRYCWGCHGARGDGNGENAPYVTPQPRNAVPHRPGRCRSIPTCTTA